LGYASFRTANPLKLVIRAPGHIELSTGGRALVYKSGEILEESLLQYSDIMTKLVLVIREKMQPSTHGTIEVLEDIFNDIAKSIVRLGHGGLLLVADQYNDYFSSERRTNSLVLKETLLQYYNSVANLVNNSGGVPNLLNKVDKVGNRHSSVVANNTARLEKCISAVANLAGMDGAIALDYECKIVAFNAIIAKKESNTEIFNFIDRDRHSVTYEDVVRNRGSRHQSALSFVMNVPKSFAFVISQDGFVSAFHNKGDGKGPILFERGMRALE
jgi:hypothetical protein